MSELVIDRVCKSYPGRSVLRDFSLILPSGSVTVLMGPSGCGKTTLLRLIMGLETPDSGEITGVPPTLSVQFQEDRLLHQFDARTNLRFVTGSRYREEDLDRELAALGITEPHKKPVAQFSGGMARRVALCRCLLAEGELLLLDEPFKGLDNETRDLALQYLRERRRGRTLLMVTHSDEEARLMEGNLIRMT